MLLNIVSSQIIKPSSPTPHHLRTHKLSILDQICPDSFVPLIFFYSVTCNDTIKRSDHLKKSLSQILTRYYPFAGRIKDDFSIVCDDYGAAFIEARVASKLSEILKQPNNDFLEQLLPFKLNGKPSFPVSLIVQVTYFGCGGMAIGIGLCHILADITTVASFIKSWATVASGSNISDDTVDAFPDFTSIFHPVCLSRSSVYENHSPPTDIVIKRFTFDGSKIAALREKIGNKSSPGYYPTRFEVVSALILGGVMTAAKDGDEFNYSHLVAVIPLNLRNRMIPPLPEQSIGSVCLLTTAKWPMEKSIDYNTLTKELHESISMITNDYVRKLDANTEILNHITGALGISTMDKNIKNFTISSWCRQPFYEADFGWGKPIWVGTAIQGKDVVVLLDSRDGKGIEALVGFSDKEMAKFEQDPGILDHASFNPSVY